MKYLKLGIILIIIVTILTAIGLHYKNQHDHKTYRYTYNNVEWHTFEVCGDTALVTSDKGYHLDYIPRSFKEFIKPEYRVK